jgi:type II secretion system protein G
LYVRTIPEGADVYLDGKQRGQAPQLFEVPAGVSTMIVEVELDGHGKQRQVVAIEGGRIARVEFKFDSETQPSVKPGVVPRPQPHYVTLVVGKDRMTFQGEHTTWKELPALIEKITDRKLTVLNIARAPGDMTAQQWDEAMGRAIKLVERFGLQYLSQIGEHPLGYHAPETQASPDQAGPPSFGPAVEQVLNDPKKGVAELLDLDTGRRATMKEFGRNDRETHAWVREQKVDVMGAVEGGLPGVLLFDCAVYENPGISWEKITPQEVVDHRGLNQTEPKPITPLATQDPSKLPLTCLFETREKTKGVLQLVGLSDDKQGVKIRYKLVRHDLAFEGYAPVAADEARAQMAMLRNALELYRLDVGSYPTTGQNLKALVEKPADLPEPANWQGPYPKKPVPVDPWGKPYRYQSPGREGHGEYSVWSAGPDGVDATDDDIGHP